MRSPTRFAVASLSLALLAACGPSETDAPGDQMTPGQAGPTPEGAELPTDHPPVSQLPADHPTIQGDGAAPPQSTAAADARSGTVLEVLQSAGYTYARMDFDGEELWVAGPVSPLEEGDEVTVSGLMGMTDFYARSLDRTFEAILFASTFSR